MSFADIYFLKTLFSRMTIKERNLIKTKPFNFLWETLWINDQFKEINRRSVKNVLQKFIDYFTLTSGSPSCCQVVIPPFKT